MGGRAGRQLVSAQGTANCQFFISANGVWLTEHVPPAYLEFPSQHTGTGVSLRCTAQDKSPFGFASGTMSIRLHSRGCRRLHLLRLAGEDIPVQGPTFQAGSARLGISGLSGYFNTLSYSMRRWPLAPWRWPGHGTWTRGECR